MKENIKNEKGKICGYIYTHEKKQTEFKIGQWVLVRNDTFSEWSLAQFSHILNYDSTFHYYVVFGGTQWNYCISYKGHEEMLGQCCEVPISWQSKNKYDKFMDEDCIGLCDAMNELEGCTTFESCCGHCINPYGIFFYCTSPYSLAVLARSIDRRYLPSEIQWTINLETTENSDREQYCYELRSNSIYKDDEVMRKDVKAIIKNINHWSNPEFYKHFKHK